MDPRDQRTWLTEQFEDHRRHLEAVAYRMLGTLSEAQDAVQETWLRVSRAGTDGVENLGGWLTTVTARVSLNMLESRKTRRERSLDTDPPDHGDPAGRGGPIDPEHEALLADSVGVALLVVLDTLSPLERLAFVLHDVFALPFDEIAPIVDRTPTAARQLASRARRRIRGADVPSDADLRRQRDLVDAFLRATRAGDLEALLTLLDPDVVLRADHVASPSGTRQVVRGARAVARGALAFAARTRFAQAALVDRTVGLVVAPRGKLSTVLAFTLGPDRITGIDVIADPGRLDHLDLAVLDS